MHHHTHLRKRNGRFSFRIVLPKFIAAHCTRRETHLALFTQDMYRAKVLSSTIRESFRRFVMTLPQYTANTYAERLDQWIADEKDAIAAHFAQHGPTLLNDADRLRMFGNIANDPQLDIEAAINHDRIAEEIDELERLFVAVRSMGIIDHKTRIKEAMTHRNQQWRGVIAPSLAEARLAIAPDETDLALQAVIERAVAKRLHEVFDHSTKVYRFEDEPHGLMTKPLDIEQPVVRSVDVQAAVAFVVSAPEPTPTLDVSDVQEMPSPTSTASVTDRKSVV